MSFSAFSAAFKAVPPFFNAAALSTVPLGMPALSLSKTVHADLSIYPRLVITASCFSILLILDNTSLDGCVAFRAANSAVNLETSLIAPSLPALNTSPPAIDLPIAPKVPHITAPAPAKPTVVPNLLSLENCNQLSSFLSKLSGDKPVSSIALAAPPNP